MQAGNWQRGGGKGRRPRPIDRPGHRGETQTTKYGGKPGTVMSLDEAKKRFRPQTPPTVTTPTSDEEEGA